MTNTAKNKGDRAEREVQSILRDLTGYPCRRALGAGRLDDVGDIHGLPSTVVSVANYADLNRAIREKLPDVQRQMDVAGATYGAMFARRVGGSYVVVMTPEQWATYWRETLPPKPVAAAECICGWPERDCVIRANGDRPELSLHLPCAERDRD